MPKCNTPLDSATDLRRYRSRHIGPLKARAWKDAHCATEEVSKCEAPMKLLLTALIDERRNDNENDVKLPFAGSAHRSSSASIRLRIYHCLMF